MPVVRVATAAVAVGALWPRDNVGPEAYRRIQWGMTRQEFGVIVGVPPGDNSTDPDRSFVAVGDGRYGG